MHRDQATAPPGRRVEFLHTLSGRLVLWLVGILVPALAGYAWLNIHTTSEEWRQAIFLGATRTSELIKRSVHHSMLLNRMEDVRAIMRMSVPMTWRPCRTSSHSAAVAQ